MQTRLPRATQEDMKWVNTQYEQIKFMLSDFATDDIWILEAEGQKAGLGRLVQIDEHNWELGGIYVLEKYRGAGLARKIVQQLCDIGRNKKGNIWCIPFNHLSSFYQSFGLESYAPNHTEVPQEILSKINYCASTFTQEVDLLKLKD